MSHSADRKTHEKLAARPRGKTIRFRHKRTLDVGTAGDAARPIKPGIHGKPLPPRGDLQPRG